MQQFHWTESVKLSIPKVQNVATSSVILIFALGESTIIAMGQDIFIYMESFPVRLNQMTNLFLLIVAGWHVDLKTQILLL
jgi:hypothetical protein